MVKEKKENQTYKTKSLSNMIAIINNEGIEHLLSVLPLL